MLDFVLAFRVLVCMCVCACVCIRVWVGFYLHSEVLAKFGTSLKQDLHRVLRYRILITSVCENARKRVPGGLGKGQNLNKTKQEREESTCRNPERGLLECHATVREIVLRRGRETIYMYFKMVETTDNIQKHICTHTQHTYIHTLLFYNQLRITMHNDNIKYAIP